MKLSLLIAVLLTACTAQTQTLRVVPVHLDATVSIPKTIQFFCTQDYNRDECLQHALELRRVLMTFPLVRLGNWSFVLVPAYKWKDLVRSIGGRTSSPAFTVFEQRTTVMLDWTPSEFSRIRIQYAQSKTRPDFTDNQFFLQYILTLGAHGAHKF